MAVTGTVILPYFSFLGVEPKGKAYMEEHVRLIDFIKNSLTGNVKRCDILIS